MDRQIFFGRNARVMLAATLVAVLMSACGVMIDKGRIDIAKIGDQKFTRGDLATLLRGMGDQDRPRIRNKADLMRVLNNHIDDQIRTAMAERLAGGAAELADVAQQIYVPLSAAIDRYIASRGDDANLVRMVLLSPLPAEGEETPLMREFDMDHRQWRARRDFYESEAEVLRDKLQGDAVISYLGAKGFKEGTLKLDPEALQREYEVRKESLVKLESLAFYAIEFPAAAQGAVEAASATRTRIDKGDSFDAVAAEFQARDPNSVSNSAIENNPLLEKFKSFWMVASGAEPGAILGPVFLPSSGRVRIDAQGKPVQYQAPDSYLVLKVLEHEPERTLTLQEATPRLAPELVFTQKLKELRKELGVEIYEDQVPDPRSEGGSTGDPVLGY